jgi:diguanylate cyclase (GGDEF)-like protein
MLDQEQARARREKSNIGVIMLDLDHFKLINDSYGHPAGDEVLREAARRLRASVRPYDGVGRYGGEEFLVVLPGCDPTAVEARAEAIRHSIAAEPVIFDDAALLVTASFGATVFGSEQHKIASSELIRAADEALYLAKQDGRNRVRFRAVRSDSLPVDSSYPLAAS